MSLSQVAPSIESNCEVEGEKGDYFNLLDLPNKTITHVFSFLDMKDRMNARVNKRLSGIEAESKYYVEELRLKIKPYTNGDYCVCLNHDWCGFDLIKRIAHNTSIERLYIYFPCSDEICRKFSSLIKEFRNIIDMDIDFEDEGRENEILIDLFSPDVLKKCKSILLWQLGNISAEALYQVYKNINEEPGRSLLYVSRINHEIVYSFLNLLFGMTYIDGRMISNINMEVFRISCNTEYVHAHIFDGLREIEFCLDEDCEYSSLDVRLHENQESADNAKKDMERIEVDIKFNLLALPNETITHVFSYLDIKDRMRARVNKRLSGIEAETKYFMEFLQLGIREPWGGGDHYFCINDKRCEFDLIKRIAQKTSINDLIVAFPAPDEFCLKFKSLIKDFRNITNLILRFEDDEEANEFMIDSFLLDISNKCEFIKLYKIGNISVEALYQVYKGMDNGSLRLRGIIIYEITVAKRGSFLRLLGIDLSSIETYEMDVDEYYFTTFFNGLYQILYADRVDGVPYLGFTLHENLESVENEKKGLKKLE